MQNYIWIWTNFWLFAIIFATFFGLFFGVADRVACGTHPRDPKWHPSLGSPLPSQPARIQELVQGQVHARRVGIVRIRVDLLLRVVEGFASALWRALW